MAPTPPTCCSAGPTGTRSPAARATTPSTWATATTRFTRTVADGIDRIEGGPGVDSLSAAGTESDDFIEVQGLLARTRLLYGFTGSADTGGIEQISMNPFGGTDIVTIRDLGGTATTKVDVRHEHGRPARGHPDRDRHAGPGHDQGDLQRHDAHGRRTPATVNLIDPERGTKFAIDARDGDDTVDATGLTRDAVQPTLKGGAGRDTIIGSSSDDQIAGGTGVDVALMGGGLDTFTWAPGDGNDIVEGGAGTDFLQMNGSGGNDRFDVTPIGSRTRVTRDIENVNLDLGGLERVDILPGAGRRHRARRRPERHRHRSRRRQSDGRARSDRRRQPDRPRVRRRHLRQRHDQRQRRRTGRAHHRPGGDHHRARHRSRARPAARRHQARRGLR